MTAAVEEKKKVTFEVRSWLRFHLEMVEYPELSSPKKWVQKGIDLIKKHAPQVLHYLSRQRSLAQLKDCKVIINVKLKKKKRKRKKLKYTAPERRMRRIKLIFKVWVQKEKLKRLILVVLESLVIPFTPFLALLPGPNVFFYIPALLLYYHLTSYLGLRKVDVDDLDIEIRNIQEPLRKLKTKNDK
ncbi:MAG: hypothetical protein PVH61_07475 [Candidatus Aminicenantes bacterium]|jgi:hypothetical protein